MRRSVFLCAVIGLIGLVSGHANAEPPDKLEPTGNVDGIRIVYNDGLFSEAELNQHAPKFSCTNGKPTLYFSFYSKGTGTVVVTTTESTATGGTGKVQNRLIEVKSGLTEVSDLAVSGTGVNIEIEILGNGSHNQTRKDHYGGIPTTAHGTCDSIGKPKALQPVEASPGPSEHKALGQATSVALIKWGLGAAGVITLGFLILWFYRYTH